MAMNDTPLPNSPQGRPESFSARRRRLSDLNLVLMCLAVCAIIIELNFISFRHFRRWDLTGNYQLSDRTRILLNSLVSDVQVYCIWGRGIGMEEQVRDVMDEMDQYTDKLKFTFLDPYIEKSEVEAVSTRYGLEANTTAPRMLFVRGDKHKLMSYSDMVVMGFQPRFKGEAVFYQGVTSVISNETTKVYFVIGHGEMDPNNPENFLGQMSEVFSAESWEVDRLDLSVDGRVPADCSLLCIMGPGEGGRREYLYSVDEANAIDAYLQRGGRVLALVDPLATYGKVQLPNGQELPPHWHYGPTGLEKVLADWGVLISEAPEIEAGHHGVVLDKKMCTNPNSWQNFIINQFPQHAITRDFQTFTFIMSYARKVMPNPQRSDVQKSVLMSSSEESIYEPMAFAPGRPQQPINFSDQSFLAKHGVKQNSGPYKPAALPLAVACSRKESKDAGQVSKLVVFGSSRFLDKTVMDFNPYNWYPLTNSMKWLLTDKDEVEAPPPPKTTKVSLTADRNRKLFWMVIAIMPSVALLLGMCIWWVRRS